jgi:magnesium-transporting ATPase (P-type)
MAGFKALTPSRANVLRDGQVIEIDAGELVVGDVVKGTFVDHFVPTQSRNLVSVSFGEKVPADVRIIDAVNLKARSVPNCFLARVLLTLWAIRSTTAP